MDSRKLTVNRKQKVSSREELDKLSHADLIDKILQLEAHNTQLKNLLQKHLEAVTKSKEKEKAKRNFDFSQAHKRHVLLRFLYFGWDYQGFACQEDSIETIEHNLFNALQKTCLIESRETSNYNRCGRTDKAVSAFGQVISIDLRSKFPKDQQCREENITNEIDYCTILNRVLPKDIRCIAWMPLKNDQYSARFDCEQRTYRFFFPRGNLNIDRMNEACKQLVGTHDFRNLCKMDVNNGVINFTRMISSAVIDRCETESISSEDGYEMYYLEIVGQAFLWHQIRCIMAVLTLIGQGNEDPNVVLELLNVERNPCKPQYSLAIGFPLNLYQCDFKSKSIENEVSHSNDETDTTEWQFSKENMQKLMDDLQKNWSCYNIKATMMREVLHDLQKRYNDLFEPMTFKYQADVLLEGARQKTYQKLLARKRCESLENRIQHYVKKQRLLVDNNMEDNE